MELGEFWELICRLRSDELPLRKFNLSAYFIFQYNMIGRVDDKEKFMWSELSPCVDFDFILKAWMCWSKNVQEERDAPEQVIFGAMHHRGKICRWQFFMSIGHIYGKK